MKDRALVGPRGWGRSVHQQQQMPAPALRNTEQTMRDIVKERGR